MFNFINTFKRDEDGAVTVDFVVVTAAVVGLGIAVLATLADGITDTANSLETGMSSNITAQTYTAQTD
ncbi:Flp family type IVb pilin [Anianabacter salinae]|uniref:Flp family type IVb pilin n=1 Tax=Anianabacter salinae TaxID=2851023 RepID=UPI00225DDD88|nr:hypothetical protein [Anianabacter salinae]MBV0911290.1 hypothetical protein [Anianabacter salinae]